jgi:hypothetical protein
MQALLYNMPNDIGAWLEWSVIHQQDHFQIQERIRRKLGLNTIMLPLDPIPFLDDMLGWAMDHQAVHNEMTAAVGIRGFDLTSVDVRRPEELTIWVQLHAIEHQSVSAALAAYQPQQPVQQI